MIDAGKDEILLSELSDTGVLRLTLNDSARRNALSEKMLATIQSTLDAAAVNPSIRVIVLASNGPAFCAGHDLKELTAGRAAADGGKAYFASIMTQCSTMMQTIVRHPKPVIAEVRGTATAAGCQLVASCDLAYAAADAKFSTPGVNIGLFCSTPMVALSRNVAPKFAMEMLLTGEMHSAARAAEIGLLNAAVAEDKLTEAVMAVATKIAGKSSMTLETGKRAFYEQAEMTLSDAYDYAAGVMVDNMLKRDAEEGVNAFLEKRHAVWNDK
ncbi:MAG: enoyl-CoA hydratase [Candidatus Puniceispirillum sp.]|nr:enoyl-CoA hydratase [Candidatus Puniceispirillum sp.]